MRWGRICRGAQLQGSSGPPCFQPPLAADAFWEAILPASGEECAFISQMPAPSILL